MVPEAGWRSSERMGSADTRSLVHRSGEEKLFILADTSVTEAAWLKAILKFVALQVEGRWKATAPWSGGQRWAGECRWCWISYLFLFL